MLKLVNRTVKLAIAALRTFAKTWNSLFKEEQAGPTYYLSPPTVNCFGVVNHAHKYPNGEIKAHLHAHVYHEGVGKKGANNVASLLIKTFKYLKWMREDETAEKVTMIFDNCTGQNKNNCVLKLVGYLVELGYFKRVKFLF